MSCASGLLKARNVAMMLSRRGVALRCISTHIPFCAMDGGCLRLPAVGWRYMSSSDNQSVSSQEVTKFSEMDEMWWTSRDNPLIAMNPVRLSFIVDVLRENIFLKPAEGNYKDRPLNGLKALDVGCGGGLLSESLARLGAEVTAIDPSVPLVEMAKKHAQLDPRTRSINFCGGLSVEELVQQSQDTKFDVICILEVLEHATDVDSLLHAAESLLRKPTEDSSGGILFISTMNRTLKSHALTIVGAEYIMGYLPVGTHKWDQYQSPEEVERRMKKVGLEPVDISGMVLDGLPLCGSWKWKLDSNDTDINWIGAYRHARTSTID